MKVLHFQSQGVGVLLSNRLNQLPNIKSRVLATGRHPFGFQADYTLPPVPRLAHWLLGMSRWGFDILHSHDGFPVPEYVLRRWKGRFIQHYHSPLAEDFYPKQWWGYLVPSFVSTPIHAKKIPNSEWLPVPVDLVKFYPPSKPDSNMVIIGYSHNPFADPEKLKYIPADELVKFYFEHPDKVVLIPLSKTLPYGQMQIYYHSLDIYVDRIGLDFYGWQASEAAACGIAIVTQMPNLSELHCPFARIQKKEELPAVLEWLMKPDYRASLSRDCRSYAAKVHDVKVVTMQCLDKYRRMLDESSRS